MKHKDNEKNTNDENDNKIIFAAKSGAIYENLAVYDMNDQLIYPFPAGTSLDADLVFNEDIKLKPVDVSLAEIGLTGLYVGKNRTLTSDVVFAILAVGETINIYGTLDLNTTAGFAGTDMIMNLHGTMHLYNNSVAMFNGNSTGPRLNLTMNGEGSIYAEGGIHTEYIEKLVINPKVYANELVMISPDNINVLIESSNITYTEGKITVDKNIIAQNSSFYFEMKNLMNPLSAIDIAGRQTVNNDNSISPILVGSTSQITFTNP